MNIILCGSFLGYLCGSILFERLYPILFHQHEAAAGAADHNPGVFNAFHYGGLWYGLFTLAGDLSKGIFPVLLYLCAGRQPDLLSASMFWTGLPFILVSPVLGHLFPIFFHFHGGEGIAVTFGVLLALWIGEITPWPVWTFACLFLFFRLIVHIQPDFYLTILVYLLYPGISLLEPLRPATAWGLALISLSVLIRLMMMPKPEGRLEVHFLWKH